MKTGRGSGFFVLFLMIFLSKSCVFYHGAASASEACHRCVFQKQVDAMDSGALLDFLCMSAIWLKSCWRSILNFYRFECNKSLWVLLSSSYKPPKLLQKYTTHF